MLYSPGISYHYTLYPGLHIFIVVFLFVREVQRKLMEQIHEGNFQAIQFYLKNRAPDDWSDRQEVNHNINLKDALTNASARVIDHQETEQLSLKDVKE